MSPAPKYHASTKPLLKLDIAYLFERSDIFRTLHEAEENLRKGEPSYFSQVEQTLGRRKLDILLKKGILEVIDGRLFLSDWGELQMQLCLELAEGIMENKFPAYLRSGDRKKVQNYILENLGL